MLESPKPKVSALKAERRSDELVLGLVCNRDEVSTAPSGTLLRNRPIKQRRLELIPMPIPAILHPPLHGGTACS
jgi:hypothetical protein